MRTTLGPFEGYTLSEYQNDLAGRKSYMETQQKSHFRVALIFLTLALILLYFGFTILAVIALAVAAFNAQGLSEYYVMTKMITEYHYLSGFIAAQHQSYYSELYSALHDDDNDQT